MKNIMNAKLALTAGIVLLTVFCNITISAQNEVLLLRKEKNGKEKQVSEEKEIKIVTLDKKKFKGPLNVVNDSCIQAGSETVNLQDIKYIRVKTNAYNIVGGVITGTGALITGLGGVILTSTLVEGGLAIIVTVLFGVPVTTAGILVTTAGVLILTSGEKYKSGKWQYTVQ